jgi:hypothetical protein
MQKVALASLLLILGGCCSTYRGTYNNGCGNGAAPIVCIDASGNANPDPVHVKRGQWLHFFAPSDVTIEEDFLEAQGHDGPQAWGRVRKDAELGRHKYTVVVNGKRNDPDAMIDP